MKFICFLLSFFWWVMAAARGRGSAKRKRTKQKSKLMKSIQFHNEWSNETKAKTNNGMKLNLLIEWNCCAAFAFVELRNGAPTPAGGGK